MSADFPNIYSIILALYNSSHALIIYLLQFPLPVSFWISTFPCVWFPITRNMIPSVFCSSPLIFSLQSFLLSLKPLGLIIPLRHTKVSADPQLCPGHGVWLGECSAYNCCVQLPAAQNWKLNLSNTDDWEKAKKGNCFQTSCIYKFKCNRKVF